jgi:hypothetical protein
MGCSSSFIFEGPFSYQRGIRQIVYERQFQHFDGWCAPESPGLVQIGPSGNAGRVESFKGVFPVDPDGRGTLDIQADRIIVGDRPIGYFCVYVEFNESTIKVLTELIVRTADLGHVNIDLQRNGMRCRSQASRIGYYVD